MGRSEDRKGARQCLRDGVRSIVIRSATNGSRFCKSGCIAARCLSGSAGAAAAALLAACGGSTSPHRDARANRCGGRGRTDRRADGGDDCPDARARRRVHHRQRFRARRDNGGQRGSGQPGSGQSAAASPSAASAQRGAAGGCGVGGSAGLHRQHDERSEGDRLLRGRLCPARHRGPLQRAARPPQQRLRTHPGAAESWKASDDGKTWTFKIAQGLVWSDGNPVTADDWVATFQYGADPKHAWDFTWFFQGIIKNWDDAIAGKVPLDQLGVQAGCRRQHADLRDAGARPVSPGDARLFLAALEGGAGEERAALQRETGNGGLVRPVHPQTLAEGSADRLRAQPELQRQTDARLHEDHPEDRRSEDLLHGVPEQRDRLHGQARARRTEDRAGRPRPLQADLLVQRGLPDLLPLLRHQHAALR